MNALRVTRWQGAQPPTASELQEILRREKLQGYTWSNGPHDQYAAHSHPYDKVIYVFSGSITWLLPQTNQEITTRAGDRLDLPRGTVHAANVGAEGVTCFEAHL